MRGDWSGLVDAKPARQHLLELSRKGIGRRAVHAACDVGKTTLQEIRSGKKKQIMARTERKILSVTEDARADKSYVPAGPTWTLIKQMLREGYTKERIAKELGSKAKRPQLQLRKDQVTALNAAKVRRVWRKLMT